jgi:hypothetical protein
VLNSAVCRALRVCATLIPVVPDPKSVELAREKWRRLFSQISYAERWHPIALDLKWVLSGMPDEANHKKLLPDYCYFILELFRRTIFKGLSAPSEVFRPAGNGAGLKLEWQRIGMAIGIGMRGLQYFGPEMEGQVEDLASHLEKLSPEEAEQIAKMFASSKFIEDTAKHLEIEPNLDAILKHLEPLADQCEQNLRKGETTLNQKAFEAGPESLQTFKSGIGIGIGAFLTPEGKLRGEGKLKMAETYWTLLLTWPEIGEMLRAQPPKRMEDLWDWLTPFSYAGWIEIQDLDQLVSLCREIKLKLKKPGAPCGPRKKC